MVNSDVEKFVAQKRLQWRRKWVGGSVEDDKTLCRICQSYGVVGSTCQMAELHSVVTKENLRGRHINAEKALYVLLCGNCAAEHSICLGLAAVVLKNKAVQTRNSSEKQQKKHQAPISSLSARALSRSGFLRINSWVTAMSYSTRR